MSERTRHIRSTAQELSDRPGSKTVERQTDNSSNKTPEGVDVGLYDDPSPPVELSIERNGESVLITTEVGDGPEASVAASVDVSDVTLSEAVAYARRLRAAHEPLLEAEEGR